MEQNDDEEDDDYKPPCPFCHGIGFYNGKICVCITGKNDDAVETLMNMFGMKK